MKAINKLIAYSTSSISLTIIILLCINQFHIMAQPIFWVVTPFLSLPIGIVLEGFYSSFYKWICHLIKKSKFLHLSHILSDNFYKNECKKINDANYWKHYISSKKFQEALSENNIIRNMWISSMIGLITAFFCLIFFDNNSVNQVKIFYWLPFAIILMISSNIRTEIYINKIKVSIYKEVITEEKRTGEKIYE